MTFLALRTSIKSYLGIDLNDSETDYTLRGLINTNIMKFIRLYEWNKIIVTEDLTLDDSDSYDLSALTNFFETELGVLSSSNAEYEKYDYVEYLKQSSKTSKYAIMGGNIYVTGSSGDLTLVFSSPGTNAQFPFPLQGASADAYEPNVIKYYYDIIEKMVVLDFFDIIKDKDAVQREDLALQRLLVALKKKENRQEKYGKPHNVVR